MGRPVQPSPKGSSSRGQKAQRCVHSLDKGGNDALLPKCTPAVVAPPPRMKTGQITLKQGEQAGTFLCSIFVASGGSHLPYSALPINF